MKTAIVTDTNSGITAQMAREIGIYLIPMPFFIDGSTYYEGETCTPDFFFRHLKAKAEVSTSQPSPEVITSLWASLLETHDAVLHFPMTAGLSGSCETAKALAQEFDGRVLVVDDHRISVTLAQSIRNALTLLAQGKTAQEVRGILEAEKDASSIYIAVNTLEYLKKSGRVTAAGAPWPPCCTSSPCCRSKAANWTPIKSRGCPGEKTLLDALRHDSATRFAGMKMAVFSGYSGADPDLGKAWQREVQAAFPDQLVELISLPLSICCHIGDGALGVACAKVW